MPTLTARTPALPPTPTAPAARRPAPRALVALLLAASVAAVAVLADQWVNTWADGHLFAAWVGMWVVVFAGSLLLAAPARRLAQQCMRGLDAWRQRRARRRADAHFLAVARRDARLMGDLRGACDRDDTEQAVAGTATSAGASGTASHQTGDSRTGHAVPGARGHTLHYL